MSLALIGKFRALLSAVAIAFWNGAGLNCQPSAVLATAAALADGAMTVQFVSSCSVPASRRRGELIPSSPSRRRSNELFA
jgi:hypothetical protein